MLKRFLKKNWKNQIKKSLELKKVIKRKGNKLHMLNGKAMIIF